ncbi:MULTISPECIES: SRPBCC family protein [unclassified Pseudovibrio]|uniref:aromatic ring-hydroxylating oxygenase subunit alpha n=1 Tax=unclassified Pseudovibrio TaxID=2627060 RepID=UPI0007AEBB31|nr:MULTISPECIES: SRPBCC family protein [unclassified Pseudovibrio]KZK98723.1 Anthranilate 1,2-dioxygenase large subunit [Pseudovibrio sp. W74]KZL09215.1 Anthranilate 1,2-dioxygenase large subunit [Pseudovibrio sp. Ad14]
MTRDEEISLIAELLGLDARNEKFLDEKVTHSPVTRYNCSDRFAQEMTALFRSKPVAAAQSAELSEANAFLSRSVSGLPVLLTRDAKGKAHAFLNVCRHRGAKLVREKTGCKQRFSCPYHAWTWSNQGDLVAVPQEQQGFPDLDRSQYGLKELPVLETHGFVWVIADPNATNVQEIQQSLAPLSDDLSWLGLADHRIAVEETFEIAANWKTLIEGGIEAYHFRVAHRKTIGPYFPENLSSYQMLGGNMRSVLPRITLFELRDKPQEEWRLREHANIIYSVLPGTQLLVQQDHIVWVHCEPLAVDRTRVRLATLAPNSMPQTDEMQKHWVRNQAITSTTLIEDFELGEEIQQGFASGANTHLTFGRFEGALDRFNQVLEEAMKVTEEA